MGRMLLQIMQDARKSVGKPTQSAFSVRIAALEGIGVSGQIGDERPVVFVDWAKRGTLGL